MMLAGCESVTFSAAHARGEVSIRATEALPRRSPRAPSDGPAAPAVPRQAPFPAAAASADPAWDVEATDAAGQVLVRWTRLRLRDIGALPPARPWPLPLLACYLERVAGELGLHPTLQVRALRSPVTGSPRPVPDASWVTAPAGPAGPPGLLLQVRAAVPAWCGWQVAAAATARSATARPGREADAGEPLLTMIEQIQHEQPGGDLDGSRTSARQIAGVRWLLLQSDNAVIAGVVLEVAGVSGRVAIALGTGRPGSGIEAAARSGDLAASLGMA
jgi:hypothetical protein